MKEPLRKMLRNGEQRKAALIGLLYWFFAVVYWELLLHIVSLGELNGNFAFVLGFSFVFASGLTLLQSFFPGKLRFAGNMIVTAVLIILYGSQLVYYFVFATLYSVSMMQQGGAAVTSFWKETVATVWEKLPWLLSLFLPMLMLCMISGFRRLGKTNPVWQGSLAAAAVLVQAVTVGCLSLGGTGYFTNYYYYHSNTDQTEDEKIRSINAYCESVTGTAQNAYTGMLKDYNLILICAESFSSGALHPELTPTLYRMANEGFVFTNYYNTYPNNTTDGEYTLCLGLYPDSSRKKQASSFYASRNSYLPFALGNLFQEQRGVTSWGYHNASGSYYGRNETYPNMGYNVKFSGVGMKFSGGTPYSDLEMMEQTVDDYLNGDAPFHAYYMTFSGHYKYDKNINPMAARNWEQVKDLPLSGPAKAYLSCNIELDKALAYLMQRLEDAGVADKTAIVLVGDHFPYGLTDKQYSELVGYEIDSFTKYKSSLLFWVDGMEEPVIVEEYCCNVDVLPTILNLWGFDYDSRMLAGTDVLSNGAHMAVLSDSSFFTDKVWFSAETGEVRYLVEEGSLPPDYVENMIRQIEARRSVSVDILNSAYYNFVFDKGDVTVNRYAWGG